MESKVIRKRPMLWRIVKLFFPLYDPERHVFTFGDRIYYLGLIDQSILVHEEVHCCQMGYSKAYGVIHFLRYRFSKAYRYRSELEAFRAEYWDLCRHKFTDENSILRFVAKKLSSPFYEVCTFDEAMKALVL